MGCYFKRDGNCAVTTRNTCAKCSFFKTEQEVIEGRAAARERISSLPLEKQIDISDKYYTKIKVVI